MTAKTPIWKKKSPKKGQSKPLTAKQKRLAKERADQAGRNYPNLIDNMWASRQ